MLVSLFLAGSSTAVASQYVVVNPDGTWSATFVHSGTYAEYSIAVRAADMAGNESSSQVPSFFVGQIVVRPNPDTQPVGRPEDGGDPENETSIAETIIPELPYTPALATQHDLVMPEDSSTTGAAGGGDGSGVELISSSRMQTIAIRQRAIVAKDLHGIGGSLLLAVWVL